MPMDARAWLHWHDRERERRRPPDYHVRRADGSAAVVDVRADERIALVDAFPTPARSALSLGAVTLAGPPRATTPHWVPGNLS
jgi:hypothetical protein